MQVTKSDVSVVRGGTVVAVVACAMAFGLTGIAASAVKVSNLRCEYNRNPIGVDVPVPRLSWVIEAPPGKRGVRQTAWQVLVA
ncbi:MAG: hypothetical protein N3G20_11110 [Verrucomicrobiae bacterium]|nr:hypothetical protein [Verrucomicrobiae bacterium]